MTAVVVSFQHEEDVDLESLREAVRNKVLKPAFWDFSFDKDARVFLNPGGAFWLGSFEADTGLAGRKLMVDTHGAGNYPKDVLEKSSAWFLICRPRV